MSFGKRKVTRYKRGHTWYAKWRDPLTKKGRTRSLKTGDADEAERRRRGLEKLLNVEPGAQLPPPEELGSYTLGMAVFEWLDWKQREKPKSRQVRENLPAQLGHLTRFLGPDFPLSGLEAAHLGQFNQVVREGNHAPATQRDIIGGVRQFCRWLSIRMRLSLDIDQVLVQPTVRRPREIKWLTPEEIRAAVAAARVFSPDAEGLVLFPILCGLRASEVLRLLWRDVDLERRQVRVMTHDPDPEQGIIGATIKAESSDRSVPLDDMLVGWLRRHRETFGHGPYVFMHPERRHHMGQARGGLSRVKNPAKRQRLKHQLASVCARETKAWQQVPLSDWRPYRDWPRKLAQWIRKSGCPYWDCRIARHTFATMLAQRGFVHDRETGRRRRLTTIDLQRLMGHSSITTTERHYLGHFSQLLDLGIGFSLNLW